MKIALVSQEYPPESGGGIATQTYTKAKGLAGLGHKIFVITRSIDECRHESKIDNIVIIRIPGMENQIQDMRDIVQWITYSTKIASEIEALHKRENLEIIDFPEWGAEGYIHLLNRYKWNFIPVVIQLHGSLVMFSKIMNWPDIDSEFFRVGTHMEATSVRLADAVYSSSDCSAQWIRKYYNPQKKDIPIIHVGVDTKLFAPQHFKKHARPTIIFVGKFVRNKGVIELVEAACNLVKEFPDLSLRMIGQGDADLIKYLQEKALTLEATNLLDLPGFVQKEHLAEHLSKAHVFAAPSHYEGGPGFVYLEAMACGLPVIGCSGSGIDEIITSGENGFLVPPGDVHSLEKAIRKLLSDKSLAENISTRAREFVLTYADSDSCLKTLEAFYYSVIKSATKELEII